MLINGRSFRVGVEDALACQHRDISVCDECLAACPNVVNVLGAAYYISDLEAWNQFVAEQNIERS